MTKMKGTIAGVAMLALAVIGLAKTGSCATAGISDIAWDQSNLSKLRSFDKDDVFDFVSQQQDDPNYLAIQTELSDDSRCVEGLTWADLAGNNQYRLVVVFEPPGTSITNSVVIYSRSSSGKITSEVISCTAARTSWNIDRNRKLTSAATAR